MIVAQRRPSAIGHPTDPPSPIRPDSPTGSAALGQPGRRDDRIRALLTAEHHAPEETHTRPAVRSLISALLTSGRTTSELRDLAARSGVLT